MLNLELCGLAQLAVVRLDRRRLADGLAFVE